MAATFSYAQAAKGISSPVSVSKPASGSATPAKDDASKAPITSTSQVNSWADDAEIDSSNEQPTTNGESQTVSSKPAKLAEPLEGSTTDLDSLSASTVTKDDDASSQPNTSSESTWDNKSQASTSVDKAVEPVQKTSEKPEKSEKGRKGKRGEKSEKSDKKEAEKEKEPPKPLKEAPLPAVNIWQQRADQQKSQARPVASLLANGASKKSVVEGRPSTADNKSKAREEDKAATLRKDTRGDADKKSTKGKPYDKDAKPSSSAMPLPPNQDQESWPTPETAVDEDRKKAQEKIEKERKDSAPNGTTGKHEWVKVPYTPSVVFNTPLPNAANPRRGGRPGGRGGAQSNGRPAAFGTNGVVSSEKDASSADAVSNGEQPKREANGIVGDASPKSKRSGSAASPTLKEQVLDGDKTVKGPGAAPFEPEAPKRTSTMTEMSNQNGSFPRQYPSRAGKGRRGDFNGSERRKDGDVSPNKDTNQTDGSENERRPVDGVHPKQSRYNNSFSGGRDRPRGGGRGGRGGFANGTPFVNGHAPQGSASFSMGANSPTTFSPGSNAFFTASQGKYPRNGNRSQSVNEQYRYNTAFSGAQQLPPPNAYNMYDYNMVAPVAPMPYSPFGVDQFALFQMITTQVEYYFSVDNLLKDMYLRKHMDSQGFVSLDFIAAFNRIKSLTTDIELLKLVCQQSSHVQYRTGEDGRDRLRRREGWDQWVLTMSERDESAQNEGPKELHNPPVPNPAGFDQSNPPQYPTLSTGYGNDVTYPQHSPFVPSPTQDATQALTENLTNGVSSEDADGAVVPNGQPIEESTKAVSAEPDLFSDAQLELLTVVVRKQNKTRAALRPTDSRTFSNGSLDSKCSGVDELDKVIDCRSRADGAVTLRDVDCGQSPTNDTTISTSHVRLYWVKGQETPVGSAPSDITHESYFHLRLKALQQRQNTPFGSTCYDMEVLYQFWSHFLIRNFNTQMYEEFQQLAFEDAFCHMTNVGLSSLLKLYSQSLLSSQTVVRYRVAHDYIALVESEDNVHCPAFKQLRSDLNSIWLHPRSEERLRRLLTDDLQALLSQ